jgi:hypothetical protein
MGPSMIMMMNIKKYPPLLSNVNMLPMMAGFIVGVIRGLLINTHQFRIMGNVARRCRLYFLSILFISSPNGVNQGTRGVVTLTPAERRFFTFRIFDKDIKINGRTEGIFRSLLYSANSRSPSLRHT